MGKIMTEFMQQGEIFQISLDHNPSISRLDKALQKSKEKEKQEQKTRITKIRRLSTRVHKPHKRW